MPSKMLSDKARGVFAFAAYHQLSSGEPVIDVALRDKAGHAADADAIAELESGGFVAVSGERAAFTDAGKTMLGAVIAAIRGA